MTTLLSAVGIGRPGETAPRRPHLKYLVPSWCPALKSVQLSPWTSKFRFGWALGWDGLYWHRAIGIKGPDWNERSHPYYGPPSCWRELGPFAYLRWRRRGSLRSDIQFERNMGCHCQHIIVKWFQGRGRVKHCVLCARLKDAEAAES